MRAAHRGAMGDDDDNKDGGGGGDGEEGEKKGGDDEMKKSWFDKLNPFGKKKDKDKDKDKEKDDGKPSKEQQKKDAAEEKRKKEESALRKEEREQNEESARQVPVPGLERRSSRVALPSPAALSSHSPPLPPSSPSPGRRRGAKSTSGSCRRHRTRSGK